MADDQLSATLRLHVTQSTSTEALADISAATFPYLIIQGPNSLKGTNVQFELQHTAPSRSRMELVKDFSRLAVLGLLGAVLYFVTCMLLNIREAVDAVAYLRKRVADRLKKKSDHPR